MKIDAIRNQQNTTFGSQIRSTNVMGFAVNAAIKNGDKGFFNALKHLANDGLKRDVFISGMNITGDMYKSATVTLRVNDADHSYTDIEHSYTTSVDEKNEIDSFELMGKNAIKLIKKLASETGNISKEALNEKASKKMLIKECNEIYNSNFLFINR
ncbi:hypothetical protein IKB17_05260 [bacterium]|nr:hypothetical protein [bacterium]